MLRPVSQEEADIFGRACGKPRRLLVARFPARLGSPFLYRLVDGFRAGDRTRNLGAFGSHRQDHPLTIALSGLLSRPVDLAEALLPGTAAERVSESQETVLRVDRIEQEAALCTSPARVQRRDENRQYGSVRPEMRFASRQRGLSPFFRQPGGGENKPPISLL